MLMQWLFNWLLFSAQAIPMGQDVDAQGNAREIDDSPVRGSAPDQHDEQGVAFFESRIRPVLREQCVACHNVNKRSGGLTLDHREGWMAGGESGDVIVPGHPEESLLLDAIRNPVPDRAMPLKAPKLDDRTIADIAEWIRRGAPDPRLEPEELTEVKTREWSELRDERAKWWSFQPLAKQEGLPAGSAIDELIDREIQEARVKSADQADRRTLIRRLSYSLHGLPPAPSVVEVFLADESPEAWERCVDRMLDSPAFGERWARHWMDVVRYADTHGSEDDAWLPFSYRYRDYIVRAFNGDVPFDQLIREHIAGDLIPARWNHHLELNESIIGTAFWRFVEFNQTPVDVKREEILVIDNQIDALGKAFQALTISCARCHDHKFDPISDEDYYALYGILRSTRAGMRILDGPEKLTRHDDELQRIGRNLKSELATDWLRQIDQWPQRIRSANAWLVANAMADAKPADIEAGLPADAWVRTLWSAKQNARQHPMRLISEFMQKEHDSFRSAWDEEAMQQLALSRKSATLPDGSRELFDVRGGLDRWRVTGAGLPADSISEPGGFAIQGSSNDLIGAVLERGYHSNNLSDRHAGSIRSPDFLLEDEKISVLARGTGKPRLRLVIENFQGDSLLFETVNPDPDSDSLHWYSMTIRPQWRGLRAHIELMTRDDKPYVGVVKDPERFENSDGRSGFGVARVVAHAGSVGMQDSPRLPDALWTTPVNSADALAAAIVDVTRDVLTRWQTDRCTDNDARWLSVLIRNNLLAVRPGEESPAHDLVREYLELERGIPVARRSPGVFEDHFPVDQEFLPRGNHKEPQIRIGRRYLEILGGVADNYFSNEDSGRLRLAGEIANCDNPLTARVYVNRLWHWMFGKGLVSTVDNFGRMGTSPTHPELLDALARNLIDSGWSTKKMLRAIALSHTWQRDSIPHTSASEIDPANRLWSHFQMQRLDAESIHDTMLAVSQKMRESDSGPGTRVYYRSVFDEKKQAPPGPLDGDHRRALFLEVRRNFSNEFLATFDFPSPSAPTGRRIQTTDPAQSLTLLNDPYTIFCSNQWATRVCVEQANPQDRIRQYYVELLAREPTPEESNQAIEFVASVSAGLTEAEAWQSLAHAMFNLKEAIFLR